MDQREAERRLLEQVVAQAQAPLVVGLLSSGTRQVASAHCAPGDRFQVGSLSKLVCATALARLVEQEEITLDDPIRRWLPGLQLADEQVAERVSVRHLLLHRGGWQGDFYDDFGGGDLALRAYVASLVQLPQLVPLDSAFSYSNSGFGLLGHLIAECVGLSFEQAVEALVLGPLGLGESGYPDAGDRPADLFRSAHPGGGFRSTVEDLLRLARHHLAEAPSWLGEPAAEAGQLAGAMAPGWMVDDFSGVSVLRLAGTVGGQAGLLALVPSAELAFAATGADLGALGEAMGTVLRERAGLVQEHPTPSVRPPQDLADYLGSWRAALDFYDLREESGELVLHRQPLGGYPTPASPRSPAPAPSRLRFLGDDVVQAVGGPARGQRGDFLRDGDGSVRWFRWEGRLAGKP